MLGSIIHNDRVIAALEALGARQADSPQQVRPGETVIIRAHGETREALRVLEERGAQMHGRHLSPCAADPPAGGTGRPVRAGHPSSSEKRTIRR